MCQIILMSKNDFFPFIALILVAGQLFNFLPTEDTVNKKNNDNKNNVDATRIKVNFIGFK